MRDQTQISQRKNALISQQNRTRAVARRETPQFTVTPWMIAALVLLSLLLAVFKTAAAAPQILGLVASSQPLPMKCENGLCATEASVFCLQKWRASPAAGMTYNAARGTGLQVIALGEDGKEVIVPDPELNITALRGHSAVRIGVDVEWLYKRKYQSISLKIGEKASLIPEAWAGDENPQTPQDVELALGKLRDLGDKLVDKAGRNVQMAQLLQFIAGKLPRLGRAHDDTRNAVWHNGTKDLKDVNRKVLARTKRKFDRCHDVTFGGMTSLRQCLGAQHDILMGKLNARYWGASEYGM
jgi:hypothetical protein